MTNEQNISNFKDFQLITKKTNFLECVLSGRIGNIILEIFSAFYFIKTYHLYNYSLIIDRKYNFINLKKQLINKNYLDNIFPFFENIQSCFKNSIDYKCIEEKKYFSKAYGKWLGLSFNAQLIGKTLNEHITKLNLQNFSYIETNFFDSTFNNVMFYKQNSDAAELFNQLFYNKKLFKTITECNTDNIAYCIRLGDFKTLMPQCLMPIEQIKNEIYSIKLKYPTKNIIIFSDDIIECKKNLKDKTLTYYVNINDYVDLINVSKCYKVFGNKFSTFVQIGKILNYIQYDYLHSM